MNTTPLRWGILGTGHIAREFIRSIAETPAGIAVASGSRHAASAAEFKKEYPAFRCHTSYEDLAADPEVDAIYVATPHPFHLKGAVAALSNGKPVLCEKPLAMNLDEGRVIVDAARANKCALAEAFRYRFHPQTHKVRELIETGAIGKIRMINASFCFSAAPNPASRLFNATLGASAILDVGTYPMSMVRMLAGAAHGKPFENPITLQGLRTDAPGADPFDLAAVANLRFSDGLLAQIRCAVTAQSGNTLEILGTGGSIEVPQPWRCSLPSEPAIIRVHGSTEVENVEVVSPISAMGHEALAFAELVQSGKLESPLMSWDDSLGNLAAMDHWRENS